LHEVLSQGGVNGVRVLLGFELRLVDADQLLPPTGVFAEAIVGNAVKPGRKLRFTAKAPDVLERLEESFLGEIIGEGGIGAGELTEHTSDRGLMPPDKLGERMVVVIEKNSRNEVCIGQ
jgi:hypothetical protein